MELLTIILGALGGSFILEVVRGIRFSKQSKAKEDSSAMDSTASTLQSYGQTMDRQSVRIKELTEQVLTQQSELLNIKQELQEIKQLLKAESFMRTEAEKLVCLVTDCPVREPKLGTYGERTEEN